MMTWRKVVTKIPGRLIQGDGYVVEIFSPNGLRYSDGANTITLWSAILKGEPDEHGKRSFWIFDYVRAVYLPTALKWDSGTGATTSEVDALFAAIRQVHRKIRNRLTFITDDEVYRKLDPRRQ